MVDKGFRIGYNSLTNTNQKDYIMTKFAQFDKVTLKALRAEMQEVMNKYAVKANLEIEVGNMSFSDAEVNIKIQAKVKGAVTMTDRILQMEVDRLGLKMENNAKGDQLVKYNSRSYKYPFVYSKADGKMYKCDGAQAKRLFA